MASNNIDPALVATNPIGSSDLYHPVLPPRKCAMNAPRMPRKTGTTKLLELFPRTKYFPTRPKVKPTIKVETISHPLSGNLQNISHIVFLKFV